VYIDPTILNKKRLVYENWHFLKNNINYEKCRHEGWTPCAYYDQLNKAINASHSIFNYSNFLAFLPYLNNLPARELLVLDEGHLIEAEVLKHVGISLSGNWFRKYFPYFRIEPSDNDEYGDDEIDRWVGFLDELWTRSGRIPVHSTGRGRLGAGGIRKTITITSIITR
jgi:Rad3-related DNA helicase